MGIYINIFFTFILQSFPPLTLSEIRQLPPAVFEVLHVDDKFPWPAIADRKGREQDK